MRNLLTILVLTVWGAAAGADEPDRPGTFSLYWENDGGWAKPNDNNDRHYTNGMAASFAFQPQWARQLADSLGGDNGAAGLIAGQLMFTPQDIEDPDPIPGDQPYAGYLFLGGYWQRQEGDILDHLQLDLGFVGPESGAEDVQERFHNLIDADDPRGWEHQLDDEFTGQLTFRRKWLVDLPHDRPRPEGGFHAQLIPQAGLSIGSIWRQLEAGATLRAGWNLPDDFGPGRLLDPASATGSGKLPGPLSFYLFARAGGRLVEHNIFLDGNNFRSSPGVDSEPLVGELQGGAALGWQVTDSCLLGVIYSQTYLTREFEGQHETDSYGAWVATLTCLF